MKAIVCSKYGSAEILRVEEMEKPVPKDNQVCIKIYAASLNYGNVALLRGKPFPVRFVYGLQKPKYAIPGGDIAGIVEAVGPRVTQFKIGDEVFGDLSGCGWGGFAEYVCAPETAVVHKPINISFEEAAATPMAAVTALQALRDKANIREGQKILIYGASGGVGTFAAQIARALGGEVTAVCSTRNVAILQSFSIEHIIDYKKEDIKQHLHKYDVILGVNGSQPLSIYRRALHDRGVFVCIGGSGMQLLKVITIGPLLSIGGKKKVTSFLHKPSREDLEVIKGFLEEGQIKPVIERCYPLDKIAEAFTYFEQGHAQGKIIITV
ncbi:NAD(P)-dependent alcohol dehydrogenase [Ectobacillus sp. JY-23]|uniref:NAD(P)-dependent alcohol dehydrogenase n=1 Tax=Ectobacillus sp. JY-23 TaxID=2933872 RepID=UPI001FF15F3B|nr:NAD(P)-dependent alcohol dehydrogenase [Ectobacillus sp. JY-23]UOY91746.1 NAD(P)-dependent alcohol dehydrogenase [Ectobacillus sp. JY-23]